eukprot:tig00020684_g12881.t1
MNNSGAYIQPSPAAARTSPASISWSSSVSSSAAPRPLRASSRGSTSQKNRSFAVAPVCQGVESPQSYEKLSSKDVVSAPSEALDASSLAAADAVAADLLQRKSFLHRPMGGIAVQDLLKKAAAVGLHVATEPAPVAPRVPHMIPIPSAADDAAVGDASSSEDARQQSDTLIGRAKALSEGLKKRFQHRPAEGAAEAADAPAAESSSSGSARERRGAQTLVMPGAGVRRQRAFFWGKRDEEVVAAPDSPVDPAVSAAASAQQHNSSAEAEQQEEGDGSVRPGSYLQYICSPRRRRRGGDGDEPDFSNTKFTVFGGGAFGTALASLLAAKGCRVDMLVRDPEMARVINEEHRNPRYLSDFFLPETLRATTEAEAALDQTNYILHAIPVQHSADFLQRVSPYIPEHVPILSTSKGLEVTTLELMSSIIPRALGRPDHPTAFLSGPSFAREVIQDLPTAVVVASEDRGLAKEFQRYLHSTKFRVYTSTDVIGVEAGGALKNVLAIGAGALAGLELGSNAMASLVTRGVSEIQQLAVAMGGRGSSISGLSGLGDITLTCLGALSRNRQVGERLGRGENLEDIIKSMNGEAEGVATAQAAMRVARKYKLHLPILFTVAELLAGRLHIDDAEEEIMSLPMPVLDEDEMGLPSMA